DASRGLAHNLSPRAAKPYQRALVAVSIGSTEQLQHRPLRERHSIDRHAAARVHGKDKKSAAPVLEPFITKVFGFDFECEPRSISLPLDRLPASRDLSRRRRAKSRRDRDRLPNSRRLAR